ncbi:hypothetical protein F4814DRAFT_452400 [Daldinia grandis]|nr:hypothetical protein F4814DRAFT_452400 [Daldinia grandis]
MHMYRTRRDLWKAALQKLEQSDKKLASSFRDDIDTRLCDAEVNPVLKQAAELYKEYREKLLEHNEGTPKKRYAAWNKMHKMINSIMQLKGLLDAGLKFDPSGYGAIAWAATSFCFQMAINHKDKAGSVLDGAEYLTHLLARYALIETRYFTTPSSVLDKLESCVVSVYESILQYLAEMKSFQSQTKLGIILKSITPLSDSALKKFKDSVFIKDQEVDKWTALIENECHSTQIKELQARAEALILPMYQIDQKILYVDEYIQRQHKRDVLDWISTTNPGFHHKSARDRAVGPGRQAPGIWILNEPEYKYWQTAIILSILWLSGDLGTGKTILMSTMIEHISTLYGKQNQCTMAYVYCSATLGTNVDSILRSILRQLAESKKGLDMVVEQWKAKSYGKYLLTLDEAKAMIKNLVSLNGKIQTTIIIDALDEINLKDLSTLFDFLHDLLRMDTTNCLLKVLLSSRPEMRVSDAIGLWPRIKVNPSKTKLDTPLEHRR